MAVHPYVSLPSSQLAPVRNNDEIAIASATATDDDDDEDEEDGDDTGNGNQSARKYET